MAEGVTQEVECLPGKGGDSGFIFKYSQRVKEKKRRRKEGKKKKRMNV
jgi:hypothetical protein